MFKSSLIACLVASATANIPAKSKAGQKILSEARKLNGGNYYEEDFSWLSNYDLKFEGCSTIHSYDYEVQNDEEGNEAPAGFGTSQLAKFKLCESDHSCSTCANAGVYMVPLREFAQYYLEIKIENQQNACARVEENCNCNGYYADDSACLSSCYKNAGLDFCDQEFDPTEFVECTEYEFENYYGNNRFFVGPVCSETGGVNLALFTDMYCSKKADDEAFSTYSYGRTLPYSQKELISNDCVSCLYKEDDDMYNNYQNNNNNNNNRNNNGNGNWNGNRYYQNQATDTCTALYEESSKCETKMTGKNKYQRDTGSCDYIENIVPALERIFKEGGIYSAAPGLAWFFAITTFGALGAAAFFFMKAQHATVNLNKEGALA